MITLDQSSVCGSTAMLFERAVLDQSAAAVSYPACSQQQFKHYNYENTKQNSISPLMTITMMPHDEMPSQCKVLYDTCEM